MSKKRGLGKGLSALIPNQEPNTDNTREMMEIALNSISPNPNQPRQRIDEASLNELAESIKTHGLIQPIVVRKSGQEKYEIIAGERRWQACKKLRLENVPVIIKDYNDLEASAVAIIENIQREDLNALEEANAYKRLMDNYNLTQEELSSSVGKSRSFIANMVRILGLPEEILDMLAEGIITAGHARALLPLQDSEAQIRFTLKIIKQHLSVRKTEELVKKYLEDEKPARNYNREDTEKKEWERKLADRLGHRVKIRANANGSGKLIIEYTSKDELINIIDQIKIS